jgi:hypothetical protein
MTFFFTILVFAIITLGTKLANAGTGEVVLEEGCGFYLVKVYYSASNNYTPGRVRHRQRTSTSHNVMVSTEEEWFEGDLLYGDFNSGTEIINRKGDDKVMVYVTPLSSDANEALREYQSKCGDLSWYGGQNKYLDEE